MDMLLRHINHRDLADMLQRHAGASPAPELRMPQSLSVLRRRAKQNGIWDKLNALDPDRPIPAIKRSQYRNFQRNGDRDRHQALERARKTELDQAALALWLRHPKASLDYLQDLLWAYCEDSTWVMAAHENRAIDLGAAMLGASLAELLHLFEDQLEEEVRARVDREIETRIFRRYRALDALDNWNTNRNNWNHVCNGEIVRAALYRIQDPVKLAHFIHTPLQNMTYALDGFAEDGGCHEGPGYWAYGFGHFVRAAHALHRRTEGEINLMEDPSGKIEKICRFPLAPHIEGPLRATFSDSDHGFVPAEIALRINAFYRIPELYGLCDRHPDQKLKIASLPELALYSGFKVPAAPVREDALLPDLGLAKVRSAPGPRQMTLLCLAGHNGVPHNHNDIGSFIVHKQGRLPLVDPGRPIYRRETFSPARYDILFCNSLGHSVPLVNGKQQVAGATHRGTLRVDSSGNSGEKRVTIDMTRAYPRGTIRSLVRTFILDTRRHALTLEDRFCFSRQPRALEEGFVTYETVRATPESVRIGPRTRGGILLTCPDGNGVFSAERMVKESRWGKDGRILTRIRYIPNTRQREMTLRFHIE